MTLKTLTAATLFAGLATTTAMAAPTAYTLDPSHSQIVFQYNHLGYSTTTGMFSGFEGDIQFDAEDPAASSVSVSMPVTSMFTGWEERDGHFMTGDFFNAEVNEVVSFTSTGIEVTGDNTALITGDLTMNGITKPVVLDTVLNKADVHPMAGVPFLGLSATATVLRSDYGLDMFAPAVSDEVAIQISIEAAQAE